MGATDSKVAEETMEFNPDILNSVPSDVRSQLEKYAESRNNLIGELTESYEKLKVDSEQRIFEIEKQLLVTNEKFKEEAKNSSELRQQLAELETKYNETANKVRELQTVQFEKDERCNALEQINRQLSSEKQELSNALDKKSQEVEQLTSEWKQMSERVAEASRRELEAFTKLGEIQSKNVSAEHREERMKQELENVQRENSWLHAELNEKTNQLLSARKEQSGKIFELQSQLNEKSDEVARLQQLVDSLKECVEDQNVKMENYIQKLKDASEFQNQMEEHYKAELQSQERLTELYKNAAAAKEKQVDELLPAVEELQKLLKEAATAQSDLENEKEAEKRSWEALVKERDDQIRQLEKELEDANELIEAMKKKGVLPPTEENIEALSPAAAAASRLLKSGMTLTQIYSEYVKTCEALQLKEEENKRLTEDLNQIMQEIEEKAPVLMKQRQDYEKALETISHLTSQLDTAMAECEKYRLEYDEAQRIIKELTRENKRLQQTTSDLAQQVRLLLKELEEARGTVVSMSSGPDISSTDVSSTSQVISEHLVTFSVARKHKTFDIMQEVNCLRRDASDVRKETHAIEQSEKNGFDIMNQITIEVDKMASGSVHLDSGFKQRGGLGYDRRQQLFPRTWLTANSVPSPTHKGNTFVNNVDNLIPAIILPGDTATTKTGVRFFTYRIKTPEKYLEYEYLRDLSYRQLYMGLIRNTTAHGLPHIHTAQGCVKRTFWILLTTFLTGVWMWNSHDVLTSFLNYDVTVSYDIRLAHEVQFPAVTICNQNVARYSKLKADPDANDILNKRAFDLFRQLVQEQRPSAGIPKPPPAGNLPGFGPPGNGRPGPPPLGGAIFPRGGEPVPSGQSRPSFPPREERPSRDRSQTGIASGRATPVSAREPVGGGVVPGNIDSRPRKRIPPNVKRQGLAAERNELSQRKVLIQEVLIGLDPETRIDYGHQFKPLISYSQFSGYEVYNSTFKATYDLSYGNCFTFNTGASDTADYLLASNTGPDYGLVVMFVIEEEEYIGEITYKQGLRVVVHNPGSPPFPAEQGIDVAPGKSTSIGVRKVTIKRLGGMYNSCVNISKPHAAINVYEELYNWTSYTIIGCQKTCYQQAVIDTCGCFDHYFPETGVAFAQTGSVNVCSYANETQDDCKAAIYADFRDGKLMCSHCQKPCTEEYFETSISSAMWPAKRYIPTLRELYEDDEYMSRLLNSGPHHGNIGLLEVYFESLNLEEMTEQPAYATSQFIADIGGTIGLWVGASMMTIFEFGEFFLDVFVLFLAKCFRCGKERSHEERQKYVSTQQTSAIRRNPVFDPETKWNCTSTLNRSRADS